VGIFDRLGDVIKSYLNDEDGRIFGNDTRRPAGSSHGDPDMDAAWDELDDFLKGGQKAERDNTADRASGTWGERPGADRQNTGGTRTGNTGGYAARNAGIPEELRPDFALLELPFGASADECKAAYKRLLKLHHPDRHAGHEGNMRKATEKAARINAAYDRIEKWRARKN
jgi:DnaJ-domain-containing protein 1